jgi:O-acetylhomoserine (thiol)-lyase
VIDLSTKDYGFDTAQIHAGYNADEHNYSVSPPIYQTAAYDFKNVQNAKDLFTFKELGCVYARVGNQTAAILEERIKALDGASAALAVSSGMSAISYTLLSLTEGGGAILTTPYLYGGTVDDFKKTFPRFNIRIDTAKNIETPSELEKEIKPDTKAIFIESISNPNGFLLDVEAIADVAHRNGIPLVVDNTVATPYLFNPLKHGADIIVYSATKALSGHGNVIAGLIEESGRFDWNNGKFPQFSKKYWTLRDENNKPRSFLEVFPDAPLCFQIRRHYLAYLGSTLSALDAYLVLIGLETLSERVAKQTKNAEKIARFLAENEHVEWVRYASLKNSPHKKLAEKYFPKGVGGLLAFGFKGTQLQREKFIDNIALFHYHVNIGDVRSLLVNSPQTTHGELEPNEKITADIPENLIRLSLGLEDPKDLIEDLTQAFNKAFA